MSAGAPVVYTDWELQRPAIPLRSRLYSLEPIGAGKPETESRTSYVSPLAEAPASACASWWCTSCCPFWDARTWAMAVTRIS